MNWPDVSFIRVAANGINFEVATMGSGDRLALCLHGFPEHAYSWRHQMPLLASLGYRVWAPNLRGYGATDSPREISAYQPRTLVEDVASLIKAANPKETLVVAHDLGAVLAWLLAMGHPQIIDRLVILNLPHPACFAREVRKPVQFFKSCTRFSSSFPGCQKKFLAEGRDMEPLNLYARPPAIPRASQTKRWKFTAPTPRGPADSRPCSIGIGDFFAAAA